MPTPLSESTEFPQPVLITGAGGMLGYDLVRAFHAALGEIAVTAVDRAELDVTDAEAVSSLLRRVRPAVVINAAAYTNVDGAERDRDTAWKVNAEAPAILAEACAAAGAVLVHYSTDYVFSGVSERRYTEEDTPAPCNWYGETKLAGERAVLARPDALCLRVQWLYGASKDRFTKLRSADVFTPFGDQFGAPMWTREVAAVTAELLARGARGLYHVSYDDYASWADVYAFVKEQLGLSVRLEPIATEERRLPAPRPRFGVLDNSKLRRALGISGLGSWKTPLADFLSAAVEERPAWTRSRWTSPSSVPV